MSCFISFAFVLVLALALVFICCRFLFCPPVSVCEKEDQIKDKSVATFMKSVNTEYIQYVKAGDKQQNNTERFEHNEKRYTLNGNAHSIRNITQNRTQIGTDSMQNLKILLVNGSQQTNEQTSKQCNASDNTCNATYTCSSLSVGFCLGVLRCQLCSRANRRNVGSLEYCS